MPDQIRSAQPEASHVDPSRLHKITSLAKAGLSKCAVTVRNLANQLKSTVSGNFSNVVGYFGQAPSTVQNRQNAFSGILKNLKPSPVDQTMVLKKLDSTSPNAVTKQLKALRSMESVERLKSIVSGSICSGSGKVNLSFIEHFCGLRNSAAKASPNFLPSPSEGKTEFLAPFNDFSVDILANEIGLLDSIVSDCERSDIALSASDGTRQAIKTVSDILKNSANLMSKISRHELLVNQAGKPEAVSNAAKVCVAAVKQLPLNGKILIPLTFYSLGKGVSKGAGHATYMVVEKNRDDTVNLHMVNRGAGSSSHPHQFGQRLKPGQPPKIESAVSKWNLPIEQTGGFSHNFLCKTLMYTLDAATMHDGCAVETTRVDPNRQMRANIKQFYHEFGKRVGCRPPPPDHQPIYQRAQKDGNCGYSNLKASIRYLLNDQKMYNQIDLIKTEKVAKLTLGYMRENLLHNLNGDTAVLERFSFNAESAVEKLAEKFEKAELRTKKDLGAAGPLNLPPHLQNVTN
jgi:hypothetical protein